MQRQFTSTQKKVEPVVLPLNRRDIIQRKQKTLDHTGVKKLDLKAGFSIHSKSDSYEQEADHIATRIFQTSALQPSQSAKNRESPQDLQSHTQQASHSDTPYGKLPKNVQTALKTPSRRLPINTQKFMETQIGYDFSQVQIHTDQNAAESARNMDASAYTVRNHIVFGANRFQPHTPAGKTLLAHELVHVMQQSAALPSMPILQRKNGKAQKDDDYRKKVEAIAVRREVNENSSFRPGDFFILDENAPKFNWASSYKELYNYAQENNLTIYLAVPDFSDIGDSLINDDKSLDEALVSSDEIFGDLSDISSQPSATATPKGKGISEKSGKNDKPAGFLAGTIDEIKRSQKELSEETQNQGYEFAIGVGVLNGLGNIGTGILGTTDLALDGTEFLGAIIGEGVGLVSPETTDRIAARMDKKLDPTLKAIDVVAQDPIGVAGKIHDQAVDTLSDAVLLDKKAISKTTEFSTEFFVGMLGASKGGSLISKNTGDLVKRGAEAGAKKTFRERASDLANKAKDAITQNRFKLNRAVKAEAETPLYLGLDEFSPASGSSSQLDIINQRRRDSGLSDIGLPQEVQRSMELEIRHIKPIETAIGKIEEKIRKKTSFKKDRIKDLEDAKNILFDYTSTRRRNSMGKYKKNLDGLEVKNYQKARLRAANSLEFSNEKLNAYREALTTGANDQTVIKRYREYIEADKTYRDEIRALGRMKRFSVDKNKSRKLSARRNAYEQAIEDYQGKKARLLEEIKNTDIELMDLRIELQNKNDNLTRFKNERNEILGKSLEQIRDGEADFTVSANNNNERIQETLLDPELLTAKGYEPLKSHFPNNTGLDRVYQSVDGRIVEVAELKAIDKPLKRNPEDLQAQALGQISKKKNIAMFSKKSSVLSREEIDHLFRKLLARKYGVRQGRRDSYASRLALKKFERALEDLKREKRINPDKKGIITAVKSEQGSFEYVASQCVRMMASSDPKLRATGYKLYQALMNNPNLKRTLRVIDNTGNEYVLNL